jgi:hypothetical protein
MPTDEAAIRRLVENWVVWRDSGDWDRFRTVWHDDGRMMATWFQGSCDDFIRVSREGFERGVSILHFLGGISVDVSYPARSPGPDDDPSARRSRGRVRRRLRRPLLRLRRAAGRPGGSSCAADLRMTGSSRSARAAGKPDRALLESFPVGYRHLAYLQTGSLRGRPTYRKDRPEVEALYASGERWLSGENLDR